jgi:L-arabinose isomerase
MLDDFATIAGIELAAIGPETTLATFKQDLRNNDVYYYLAQGFRA